MDNMTIVLFATSSASELELTVGGFIARKTSGGSLDVRKVVDIEGKMVVLTYHGKSGRLESEVKDVNDLEGFMRAVKDPYTGYVQVRPNGAPVDVPYMVRCRFGWIAPEARDMLDARSKR